MVLFDSLLEFPIEMCVLIHRGSDQIEGKLDGCWYNMCEHALDYTEAEGLEDNLDEIFQDKPAENLTWGGNALTLVIRSKDIEVDEMLETLCFTIRDWFLNKSGSMSRTVIWDQLEEYLCWAFIRESKTFAASYPDLVK